MEKVNNHSIIHNLSNHKLTLAEITVLNKGLTFSTTESKINEVELDNDMQRFERKLQLYYFFNKDSDEPDTEFPEQRLFEQNTKWWLPKLSANITEF